MINTLGFARKSLLGVSSAALLVGLASPAAAQTAVTSADGTQTATSSTPVNPQAQAAAQPDQTPDAATGQDVVVTGTLFRRTDTETPSPVTVLSAADLEKRGITTVSEAVQRLSANGAGALPNNFTAAGAFAAGASGVSLRGLTTSSTLVLFDGLRAAYYPLADDGTRNFVDLNTIPDAIIDRIEVLKDGASSTYGADAVAGVVNVITKKQFVGVAGRVQGGISERGDGGNRRVDLTAGYGDLDSQGFNIYASGEYQADDAIRSSQRGYPYNTADLSKLCGPSGNATQCRNNGIQNGINADGSYNGLGATSQFVVRPYNAANTAAIAGSRYVLLNPAANCGVLAPVTLNAGELASTAGATAAVSNCQEDLRNEYNLIAPKDVRIGGTVRGTLKLGDNAQAYAIFNFYQNKVDTSGVSQSIRNTTTPGATGVTATTTSIALPVFLTNGQLNPQNPFAAFGQSARIVGRLNYPVSNTYLTRAYRGAGGITGNFGGGFNFSLDGTYMRENLDATYRGYIFVQNLLNAVSTGSYNFVNQGANTQAQRDFITPTTSNRSTSELWQVQGSVSKALFELPGGPLQLGVGASYRHEMVNSPSANPDLNGPANRFFTINGFGSAGKRNVKSAYFEVQAPLLDQLEVNASGRYDDYSSGQHNFSPKFGAKFTPVRQLAIRGTYSRGFRIPSFAESGAQPTTGFINVQPPAAFIAAHQNDAYVQTYGLGLTTVGTPGLRPEKSRNFTGGAIFQPVSWLSFSADYFNIRKTDLIAGADYQPAVNAYYAGAAIPAGLTVVPDVADVSFPNAQPRIAFVQYGFQNANSQLVSGLDLTAEARIPLGRGIRLTSNAEASHVFLYKQTFANGRVERYDGTLGNYQISSASGTPKWRGSWQNTLDFAGKGSLTATSYYTSGYGEEAEDADGTRHVAGSAPTAIYRDGTPVVTNVRRFIDVDLNAAINVNSNFTLYMNVYNLLDARAPYDPTTYGGYNYNPAWASAGILGRSYSAGAKVKF